MAGLQTVYRSETCREFKYSKMTKNHAQRPTPVFQLIELVEVCVKKREFTVFWLDLSLFFHMFSADLFCAGFTRTQNF